MSDIKLVLSNKSRLMKTLLAFMLCFTMLFAASYKEPFQAHAVVAEGAVFAGLAAGASGPVIPVVAGGLLVAAAATGIGIGVSALVHGESYTDACQRVWKGLSNDAKYGFVVAGTAAAPIIKANKTALMGVYLGFLAIFGQNAAIDAVKPSFPAKFQMIGNFTLSQITQTMGVHPDLFIYPNSNYGYDGNSTFKDFKVLGDFPIGSAPKTFKLSNGLTQRFSIALDNSGTFVSASILIELFAKDAVIGTDPPLKKVSQPIGLRDKVWFGHSMICSFLVGGTYILGSVISFDRTGQNLASDVTDGVNNATVLISNSISAVTSAGSSTDMGYGAIDDGNVNVANNKFWADQISALTNTLDDVIARLGTMQGVLDDVIKLHVPQADESANVPLVGDKIRAQGQDGTLAIPKGYETADDKAKNDTWNKDKDVTKVSTGDIPENPSSGSGSSSSPSSGTSSGDKLIDVTGGFPSLIGGIGDGLKSFKDLFAMLADFFAFLAKAFSYLPPLFWVIILAALIVVVILRIFGR